MARTGGPHRRIGIALSAALAVAGLVLVPPMGAGRAGPSASPVTVLTINQSATVTEQGALTVSMRLSETTNVTFVYYTFCQQTRPVCYAPPIVMTARGGGWYSGSTKPMTNYSGMAPGVVAGYNITIQFKDNSTTTEPALPNAFPNLTVISTVSGQYEFRMEVQPLVFDLSGTVSDQNTSRPVVGATVSLTPGTNSTRTDSLGAYAFTGLFNGTYTVSVAYGGFHSGNAAVTVAGKNAVQDFALLNATPAPCSGECGPGWGASNGLSSFLGGPGKFVVAAIVVVAVGAIAAAWALRRRRGRLPPPTQRIGTDPSTGHGGPE